MADEKVLVDIALKHGADRAAVIAVESIPFDAAFRKACEANSCGKYGRCWMCPPDVGDINEMIGKAREYDRAFVFQTVGQLEDSFDFEGMMDAAKHHNDIAQAVSDEVLPMLPGALVLGAGACQVCERCAKETEEPCRFPDKAIASLESYGIAVYQLAPLCGMKYINGTDTVTYFGTVLFGRGDAHG